MLRETIKGNSSDGKPTIELADNSHLIGNQAIFFRFKTCWQEFLPRGRNS